MEKKLYQLLHLTLRLNETETYHSQFDYSGMHKLINVIVYYKGDFKNQIYNEYCYFDIQKDKASEMIKSLTKILLEVPAFEKP